MAVSNQQPVQWTSEVTRLCTQNNRVRRVKHRETCNIVIISAIVLNFTFLFVLQYGRLLVKAKFGSIRRCLYELVLSSVTYGFGAPRPNTNRCSRMSANNVQALFACSRCFSRHPFEELSPGQQLCKVLLWILIFFLEKFSLHFWFF